ncbi:hypothetical protein G7054_g13598 [Neopestalotiopsis clavispora]|nr:hypothetical protein G7054_g13598 [Neopestalotiopsis clavispora]
MPQPILTVSSATSQSKKAQVNLLPCRVHHDGSINSIDTYWNPTEDGNTDNLKTAYIRGRKLHGKTVQLPAGYYGSVVEKGETKREQPEPSDTMDEVEELADPIEIAPLNSKADFDDLVIWGHESTADSATDPYLRSMEEWVSFSEKLHSYSDSK